LTAIALPLKSKKPDVMRFVGTDGDYGEELDLTKDWAVRIIRSQSSSLCRTTGASGSLEITSGKMYLCAYLADLNLNAISVAAAAPYVAWVVIDDSTRPASSIEAASIEPRVLHGTVGVKDPMVSRSHA
jgi:hypothetical protein